MKHHMDTWNELVRLWGKIDKCQGQGLRRSDGHLPVTMKRVPRFAADSATIVQGLILRGPPSLAKSTPSPSDNERAGWNDSCPICRTKIGKCRGGDPSRLLSLRGEFPPGQAEVSRIIFTYGLWQGACLSCVH